jgi:hypothetical protein
MKKLELLSRLKSADADLERVFAGVPAALVDRPGVYDDPSPKDVLAHIAAWQQLETNWLRDSLWGRGAVRYSPGYEVSLDAPDDVVAEVTNRLNDYVFQQNRDRPFDEILDDYRRTYRELASTIERMSEDDLNDPERFDWWRGEPVWTSIEGNSYAHIDEHMTQIQGWLSRQSD